MEIRRGRDGELHNARGRFQFPIIVGARIALDENAPGGRVRLHIVRCALNVDITACSTCFDAPSRTGNAKDARDGANVDIAVDFRDRHTSGRGRYAEIIANIRCGNGTAGRGELGVALDFFDADGARSGLNFYRTAHAANSLRTGGDGGAYFCVARHLNRIRDADVARTGHFLADANGVSRLFDGRIRDSLVQTLPWVVKAESRGADIATHVYFSVGAAGNVHVAGGIRDFKANRTGHVIVTIESAANRRPGIAADQTNDA